MQQVKRFPPQLRVVAGRPLSQEQQRQQVRSAFTLDREEPQDNPHQDVLEAIGKLAAYFLIALLVVGLGLWLWAGAQ